MPARVDTPRTGRRPTATGAAMLATAALAVVGVAAPATPAAAEPGGGSTLSRTAPTGWLRVAHLAPAVPAVDIYVNSVDGKTKLRITQAGYGAFTSYRSLQPGVYAVAMRPAGSSASTAPAVTWSVQVKAGQAYTVAAFGTADQISNRLISDDLTSPAAGKARVRLIQGARSVAPVTIQAVGGPLLAQNVPYGATTGYADVPAGRWALRVTSAGKTAATSVDVAAGGVYSLIVVQGKGGALTLKTSSNELATDVQGKPMSIDVTTDAAAKQAAAGGVDTGLGGMAPELPAAATAAADSGRAGIGGPAGLVGLGGAVLLVSGGALALRRRVAARP